MQRNLPRLLALPLPFSIDLEARNQNRTIALSTHGSQGPDIPGIVWHNKLVDDIRVSTGPADLRLVVDVLQMLVVWTSTSTAWS